jgi:peptide/nickel transport system permease protein
MTQKSGSRAPGAGESYWAVVRRQYRKSGTGRLGLWVLLFLLVVALLAPLLANEVPIVARYKGDLSFPAFPTYLDAFPVPTRLADWLRREVKVGGNNIFSEAYPLLEGKSWKQAIDRDFDSERGDWHLPPPVFFGYKEIPVDVASGSKSFKKEPGHTTRWGEKPGNAGSHWLGTDGQGRDVLARMIHGTIISLSVGVVAVTIYTVIGLILGTIAGYFGGWIDSALSRIVEVVICFPAFFLIIAVIAFLPRSIYNIMIVIGLTRWTGVFRLIRGEVLKVKELDYCASSRALGASPWRIMRRHVLPNAIAPVFVTATFGVAGAILIENSLSFLGFGVAPPTASWGEIVAQGREYVGEGLLHLTLAPGLAIFVTVTAFNLMGQALRDAMDPRLRA